MTRSEHNREAYKQLFAYVGASIQAFAALMIVVSIPVAPLRAIAALFVFLAVSTVWSWKQFPERFMAPTFAGIAAAGIWMLVVGLGAAVYGWGP